MGDMHLCQLVDRRLQDLQVAGLVIDDENDGRWVEPVFRHAIAPELRFPEGETRPVHDMCRPFAPWFMADSQPVQGGPDAGGAAADWLLRGNCEIQGVLRRIGQVLARGDAPRQEGCAGGGNRMGGRAVGGCYLAR